MPIHVTFSTSESISSKDNPILALTGGNKLNWPILSPQESASFNYEGFSCIFEGGTLLPNNKKCTTEKDLSKEEQLTFGVQISQCGTTIKKEQIIFLNVVKPPSIEIKGEKLTNNVLWIKEGNTVLLECLQTEGWPKTEHIKHWKLGSEIIGSDHIMNYTAKPEHLGKKLRCTVEHEAFSEEIKNSTNVVPNTTPIDFNEISLDIQIPPKELAYEKTICNNQNSKIICNINFASRNQELLFGVNMNPIADSITWTIGSENIKINLKELENNSLKKVKISAWGQEINFFRVVNATHLSQLEVGILIPEVTKQSAGLVELKIPTKTLTNAEFKEYSFILSVDCPIDNYCCRHECAEGTGGCEKNADCKPGYKCIRKRDSVEKSCSAKYSGIRRI